MFVLVLILISWLTERLNQSKQLWAKREKEPLDWPWRDLLGSAYKKAGHAVDLMRMNELVGFGSTLLSDIHLNAFREKRNSILCLNLFKI